MTTSPTSDWRRQGATRRKPAASQTPAVPPRDLEIEPGRTYPRTLAPLPWDRYVAHGFRPLRFAALLEWLLAHTFVAAELPARPAPGATTSERMLAAVRRDLDALPRARRRVELFFDYWVRGTRDPAVRATIRRALDRYRAAFLPLAAAVVAEAPGGHYGADAERAAAGLATVAATFVEGCALRVVLDPAGFDVDAAMTTLAALVRAPAAFVPPGGAG